MEEDERVRSLHKREWLNEMGMPESLEETRRASKMTPDQEIR